VPNLVARGDFCDLYEHSYTPDEKKTFSTAWDFLKDEEDEEGTAVLKIPRNAADNDLIEKEAHVLNQLFPPTAEEQKFLRYLPHLLGTTTSDGGCRANILVRIQGYVSFADILQVYPSGIDFRDFAWMLKRSLVGIGYAHKNGVIHGAVIPSHIMVHPVDHGAKIIDWCYAEVHNAMGEVAGEPPYGHIKAMVGHARDFYAPEILRRSTPSSSTDIYMLAKCAVALLGGDVKTDTLPDAVPEVIRNFLRGCLDKSQSRRPSDAWSLHEEFDGILRNVVGKPSYRRFEMPSATL
jgi:serine/threonine protein kinase